MNKDSSESLRDCGTPFRCRASSPSILSEHLAAHVAELFRAFSDTSRVRILSALMVGEMNIGALADAVGISESAVSHHMRGLRQMRMVQSRREGAVTMPRTLA